ncbi:hypothetical protein PIROE2DRAFT_60748 [Piromyces sp. E2]|nr:hypothetical protein PIROE2DRAFT_60748 [Piromyces sp. E2]|eukprot:OUM64287.1 hypothetical protein PIROE2DRAFT_60748 [Piromyces sp. E2]
MNFEEFEGKILSEIRNNDNQCLGTIENNKKLISECFSNTEKPIRIKDFVNKLNDLILNIKDFNLIEKVLNHDLFVNVLNEFRNSEVLINACKTEKKEVIEWLLSMKISPFVQDYRGMTALMYAVKSKELEPVVETLIDNIVANGDSESLNLTDKNNENVLFHAATNEIILRKFLSLDKNTFIDFNHKNNNGETVFIYCCKHDIVLSIGSLILTDGVDLNARDDRDRNGVMYLVDNARYVQLFLLIKRRDKFDVNYRNKNQETLLSHLIQQFRRIYNYTYNIKTLLMKKYYIFIFVIIITIINYINIHKILLLFPLHYT